MEHLDIEALRFPVGRYRPGEITPEQIATWIEDIGTLPGQISNLVDSLSVEELAYTYRPGGWTIHQVVHHIADSHMNAIIRFKLALTEDQPTIKPYEEAKWADLDDVAATPVQTSLDLISGIHERWYHLLKGMSVLEFARTYVHPEHGKTWDLAYTLGMYQWHGRHHHGHIENALSTRKIQWDI